MFRYPSIVRSSLQFKYLVKRDLQQLEISSSDWETCAESENRLSWRAPFQQSENRLSWRAPVQQSENRLSWRAPFQQSENRLSWRAPAQQAFLSFYRSHRSDHPLCRGPAALNQIQIVQGNTAFVWTKKYFTKQLWLFLKWQNLSNATYWVLNVKHVYLARNVFWSAKK